MIVRFFLLLSAVLAHNALAQTYTYTNTEAGALQIPLGYEVPIPVDSMAPVEGFRTYQALSLRHRQLSQSSSLFTQVEIGRTEQQRPIYAYVISDQDSITGTGEPEGAALITGGIHAREWQTPEAVTGYMEYLFQHRQDQHLSQFLLENLNLVVIPVLNVDGLLQTQRFPQLVTDSITTPREGRMRRKNMRAADESIETQDDNLLGIDLNRNNAPYWATSIRSSSDTTSLVYHGTDPGSESETQALQQAAVLAGEQNLRFYIDTHSFSQVYFAPYTDNSRRNRLTDRMADIMQAANSDKYAYVPSASGAGIGSTDEYFANTYQALSYTLEIEPANSNSEYGGTGVSHGGFILPNSEVPRMRDETRAATMAGLYAITHPPTLIAVDVLRDSDQQVVISGQWQNTSASTRELTVAIQQPLAADTQYSLRLTFNKPMRLIDNGQTVGFANLSNPIGVALRLEGIANGNAVVYDMDTSIGEWLIQSNYSKYKTDTFEQSFNLPSTFDWDAHTLLAVSVASKDYTGQNLDSDPSTVARWTQGKWDNYEDSQGNTNNDFGGTSKGFRLIDDGSGLFAPSTPAPTPPSTNGSDSGGGSIFLLFGLLCLGLLAKPTLALKGVKP